MGLQAGTVLVFSIDSDTGADQGYGIVQSVSFNEQVKRAEAMGAGGNTVSIQEHDERSEMTLEYLQKGTTTGAPSIGTEFTFDSATWYVSSIVRTETVDNFLSVTCTATNYPALPTP